MADALRTTADSDTPARFLIGIDLGTTNSAVAYVDTAETTWRVHDFAVPQLVAPAEVEARDTLPSFHYEAAPGELPAGALRMPWHEAGAAPTCCVGVFARDHGAAVPGRLIASAKSWLSHSGVDRTAPLLPWHGADDVERLSPVQVSARYLSHVRAAWDHRCPEHPIAQQDVVLTVPASFDEVARELTVQAAREAGLVKVVLVEEPQAAFYAWIDAHRSDWESRVRPGQKILVVDIGGGTSDFTLIRVRPAGGGKVLFHRVAVGEHLILGGDNLDLALAHHVESRLTNGGKLEARQWAPLVRSCRAAKEQLLGREPPEKVTINLAGGGSKLIGGSLRVELTREEVKQVLVDGFLPFVSLDEKPQSRRSGFQEFGLPYAPDAAMTRYLAAFLTAHGQSEELNGHEGLSSHAGPERRPATSETGEAASRRAGPDSDRGARSDPHRPDMVLFNGGLFESPVLRTRLLEVLESWFNMHRDEGPIQVLRNDRLDLAVARGAAYYGMVRRGKGVRITGGLAHTYFLGVESKSNQPESPQQAICLLPAGIEEGQPVDLPDRTFELLIRQPAEFPLYYSSTRTTDKPGALVAVDPEQMSPLPPIRTVLQSGRKAAADTVTVNLHAKLTEIGTLDIWCAEAKGDRQWRLQFDVRAAARADAARHEGSGEAEGVLDEATLATCRDLIRASFRKASASGTPAPQGGTPAAQSASSSSDAPAGLVKRLESATGMTRLDWPSSLMRGFWETLLELEPGRKLGIEHETRWLNLAGFCLRPGYGLAVDDWRVAQTWKLYPAGLSFAKNEQARAEWWILWRRIAGGMNAGQQATLADPLVADWRTYLRKAGSGVRGRLATFQFGPAESAEVWRLLGSLELLKPATKTEIGQMALERLAREKVPAIRDALFFCIGRCGARVPVYGPLNALLPAETAEQWSRQIMKLNPRDEKASFAVVQLTRRTNDRYRDVSDELRTAALAWLQGRAAIDHLLELVRTGGQLREEEQRIVFGENLPRGLRIE